jgi:hypothetical protein
MWRKEKYLAPAGNRTASRKTVQCQATLELVRFSSGWVFCAGFLLASLLLLRCLVYTFNYEDGGDVFLQNVGLLLPNNKELQPSRLHSSSSWVREPQNPKSYMGVLIIFKYVSISFILFMSYNIFPSTMQLIISPPSHNVFRPYTSIIRCVLFRYNCCTVWYVKIFVSRVDAIPLN